MPAEQKNDHVKENTLLFSLLFKKNTQKILRFQQYLLFTQSFLEKVSQQNPYGEYSSSTLFPSYPKHLIFTCFSYIRLHSSLMNCCNFTLMFTSCLTFACSYRKERIYLLFHQAGEQMLKEKDRLTIINLEGQTCQFFKNICLQQNSSIVTTLFLKSKTTKTDQNIQKSHQYDTLCVGLFSRFEIKGCKGLQE